MTALDGAIARTKPCLKHAIVTALIRIPAGACPTTRDLTVHMDAALDVVRGCLGEN
jgi:hypothetical protein